MKDKAPKSDEMERTCVVTREAQPPEGLIRFVRAPDGAVVPDLKGKLPGRGVWVTCRRDRVEEAVKRKAFARGFKTEAVAAPDLPDLVDKLLLTATLSALSMARKAGAVVTGFGQVTDAIMGGKVVAVIHAAEAADDGKRKVGQAVRRRGRLEADFDEDADDYEVDASDNAAIRQQPPISGPPVIEGMFAGRELDLALGGANVIHAALLAGGASASFLKCAAALARYRGGMPETDWTANLR
ncbi:RNA-binding protein [Oryzibacter oryziterrae]|uniref:RNA-binding protein n=1 Tax=Oryzibacter oryziterrae TaxID=2766474 RepID=UPI001F42DF31|nr:RNA-binding protein [Oryzibacter oryziterrae]